MSIEYNELPGIKEMNISPLTLKFKEDGAEIEYEKVYYEKSINQVRISFFLAIFLYGFLALLDMKLLPQYVYIVWVIRFSGVLPIGMLVLVSSFSSNFSRIKSGAIGFAMFMFGLGLILMIYIAPEPVDFSYYASMIITFIFIYLLTGFRFVSATAISFILLILYNITAIYLVGTEHDIIVKNNFFFIATNVIGMFGAYSLEYYSRRDYYIAKLIDQQRLSLKEFNEDLEYQVNIETEKLVIEIETRKQREIDLVQSGQELERLYRETITGLGSAVELREPFTNGHQLRVNELSVAIARKLHLSKDEIKGISLAAKIHDLGNLVVSSKILNKAGELSEEEFEIMKTHTTAGYDILKKINFPWPIADYVSQHHEYINGTGYPNNLKGDKILLGAKIICVADVFEAMTSERTYRKSFDTDYALNFLEEGKGKMFDPKVVEKAVQLIKNEGFDFTS